MLIPIKRILKNIHILPRGPVLLSFCLSLALLGCGQVQSIEDDGEQEEVSNHSVFHSAWFPYWDYNNAKLHWSLEEDQAKELVAFAVCYEGELLYIPEQTDSMTRDLVQLLDDERDLYLSFVNDVKVEDGTFIQKDKKLLEKILLTHSKREEQIEQIVQVALDYQVTGIEIDFENLKDDKELWEKYAEFIEELYDRCVEEGLGLRSVLSYDAVKYTTFPQGPHYIIMCYNLYGLHSGPGPKADVDFLQKVFQLNQVLQPEVSMAFANHGFQWLGNGDVKAITESEATYLSKSYDAQVYKDEDSHSLFFDYKDSEGEVVSVWFADEGTLSYWRQLAHQAGYEKCALWRYGR